MSRSALAYVCLVDWLVCLCVRVCVVWERGMGEDGYGWAIDFMYMYTHTYLLMSKHKYLPCLFSYPVEDEEDQVEAREEGVGQVDVRGHGAVLVVAPVERVGGREDGAANFVLFKAFGLVWLGKRVNF